MRAAHSLSPSFLALAAILGFTEPSLAQLMSKWGHPAFTIGATPYDTNDQGHGEYPGSSGFIPGYGYYQHPGQYPWIDGPTIPFDRRKIYAPLADGAEPQSQQIALTRVVVKLPAEAELWFDDFRTTQHGTYREFIAPINSEADYTISVHWQIHGAELTRSEHVRVLPGRTVTVNFLTTEGWSGRKLSSPAGASPEQLWPPRQTP